MTTEKKATGPTRVALMHPDNTTDEPKSPKVLRHEDGPLEGWWEAEVDDAGVVTWSP